jgi:hypothetical protein
MDIAVLKGRSFSCAENSFLKSGFSRVRKLIFSPGGADRFPTFTHGLRRGLNSYAASRLQIEVELTGLRKGSP